MSDAATIERVFSENGTILDEKIVAECTSCLLGLDFCL